MLNLLLTLALSQAPAAPAQTVVVDVSVVDKKGKPVAGLTASDFTVIEDDRPVSIVRVEDVSLTQPANAQDGRIAVLFLDDATPSPTGEEKQVKEIANHFVAAL